MKIKKLIALIVVAVMAALALSSCGLTPDAMILDADRALRENPYSISSTVEYTTENEELNATLSEIDIGDISVYVDGDNTKVSMALDVMGFSAGCDYILVDNVLYSAVNISGVSSAKLKAELSEEEVKDFLKDSISIDSFSAEDFESLELVKDGDTYKVIGTNAAQDYLDEALSGVQEQFEALDFDVTINQADLEITFEDGKYKTMVVIASYTFSAGEESYTVTIKSTNEFSYGEEYAVTAPADADEYTEVDYDDIFG